MSQLGLDYASVDNNQPPDFVAAYAAGARFVIIRRSFPLHDATHAAWRLVPDPHYARDAGAARAAGLVVGAYGFFAYAKGAPSAAEQVGVLVTQPGVVAGKDLPFCIDVEFTGRGIVDTGGTQAEAFTFVLDLVTEVRRQTGTSPLIYTSHGQWHDTNGLGGPDSPVLDDVPLWQKTAYRLAARQHVDRIKPRPPHILQDSTDPCDYWRIPGPWQRQGCWLQQFQGDAVGFPGFSSTVDVNYFFPLSYSDGVISGPRTNWVQQQLCRHHHLVATPGGLRDPLNAFQSAHGLPTTGSVDVATFAALCW